MSKNVYFSVALFLAGVCLVCGCAKRIDNNTYDSRSVGKVFGTFSGVVKQARRVAIENGDSLEDNLMGAAIGGVLGGVAGNAVGGGRGRNVATAVGAIGGAAAGSYAEKNLKSQEGMEYVVELTDGRIITVVQGLEGICYVNQKVFVIVNNNGRSMVVPKI